MKNAQVRKTIYSLPDLQELMRAANRRYLEFLSALEDPTDGVRNLEKLSRRAHDGQRTHRGFNLFDSEDRAVFEAIVRGEFDISGFQNRHLQALLPDQNAGQISRVLKKTAHPWSSQEDRSHL